MDNEELAARAAVACWAGSEGRFSSTIQSGRPLDFDALKRYLYLWGLSRTCPSDKRGKLLAFINEAAIPRLNYTRQSSDATEAKYAIVEELSKLAVENEVVSGRPTSLVSKLALAACPLIFIPYDRLARKALRDTGKGVRDHHYRDYMKAVLSEKSAFDRELTRRRLSAESLHASGMSQDLFEMRALDKWMMLRGGFDAQTMRAELAGH